MPTFLPLLPPTEVEDLSAGRASLATARSALPPLFGFDGLSLRLAIAPSLLPSLPSLPFFLSSSIVGRERGRERGEGDWASKGASPRCRSAVQSSLLSCTNLTFLPYLVRTSQFTLRDRKWPRPRDPLAEFANSVFKRRLGNINRSTELTYPDDDLEAP